MESGNEMVTKDGVTAQIKKVFGANLFAFKLCLVFLISFVMFIFGREFINSGIYYDEVYVLGSQSNLSPLLVEGDVIEQEFSVTKEATQTIEVYFATYASEVTDGTVHVEILKTRNESVLTKEINASEISDNSYLTIDLDGQSLEINETYVLRLTFAGIENQQIACYLTDENAYDDFSLHINDIEKNTDLVMRESYDGSTLKFFTGSYNIFILLIILLVVVSFVMIFKCNVSLSKLYLSAGVVIGFVYMFMVPINEVPDEMVHMNSAYAVSNCILGISATEDGNLMMRQDDVEHGFQDYGITKEYYNDYFKRLKNVFVDNDTLVENYARRCSASYYYLYFFSGIGITVGRLFHLSTIYIYMLGRLFNLIVFSIAVCFAIKKIPFGKMVLFLWALLPMTLQQAMSFSYDSPVMALSALVISVSLYIAYTDLDEVKRRDWVLLLISTVLLFPAKQFALTPICFVPLIVMFLKHKNENKVSRYVAALFAGMILFTILLKLLASGISAPVSNSANLIPWADEPGYTITYLLQHPKKMFSIFAYTMYYKLDFYFRSFLGDSLGNFDLSMPLFAVFPYFVMLLIAGMRKKSEPQYLSAGIKFYLCLLAIIGMGFACAGMLLGWTPISYNYIEGVQGRYFLPFAPLLFLSIRSSNIIVDDKVDEKLAFSGIGLQLPIVLCLFVRA